MTLLNNRVSEILAGYEIANNAEKRILHQWRERLLAAYTRQRESYDVKRRKHQTQLTKFKIKALKVFAFSCGISSIAILLLRISTLMANNHWASRLMIVGAIMLLLCFFVAIVLSALWLWYAEFTVPSSPQHPLKTTLIQPIYPKWRQALEGKLPTAREYEGAVGEYNFIRRMQKTLDKSHFILYRLQFKHGDDVDVTIVGPKGIWVFEVKYWSGKIIYRDQQWRRIQTYYETGGIQATKRPEVNQAPDKQWQRMAEYTEKTLRIQAPQFVSRNLTGLQIQGGIAFTHPNAEYNIASDCPTKWGDIWHWIHRLSTSPTVPGWNEQTTYAVLDALLNRHHQIQSGESNHSMKARANQLIRQAESTLATWANGDGHKIG